MAWNLIAHAAAANVNSTTTAGIDTTGADLLLAFQSQYPGAGGGGIASVTDSNGNTWHPLTGQQSGDAVTYARVWWCQGGTVGPGHTFTLGSGLSTIYATLCIQAWSGSGASQPDVQNGAVVASGATSLQTGSVTPSQDNSLIVACLSIPTANTETINDGFTISDQISYSGNNEGGAAAYLVQATAAAVNPTFSWSTSTGFGSAAAIAVFKPPAGAAFTWLEMTPLSEPLRLVPEMVGY